MKLFKLTLIHLFPVRNTQGGYSKCDQYMVDWTQVMQNIIISHSHWRNIIDHTIFVGQNTLTDRESWSVGSCTDGWEFDTENYHRLFL